MNFQGNNSSPGLVWKKSLVKPMGKQLRNPYGRSVNFKSEYTNSRGNYGFRLREHMEDVTEDNSFDNTDNSGEVDNVGGEYDNGDAGLENDVEINNREMESEISSELNSVEIPPELRAPEVRKVTYTDDVEQETGDFFDYLKQSSDSTMDKLRRLFGSK